MVVAPPLDRSSSENIKHEYPRECRQVVVGKGHEDDEYGYVYILSVHATCLN